MNLGLRAEVEAGRVELRQIDPGEIAPGEFSQQVRHAVESDGVKAVMIDSIIGYFAAMGGADVLVTQLHELMTYLTRRGVLLLLCGSQEDFMSIGTQESVDVSYLSDVIIALRFYEHEGALHRALTVVKKKYGEHRASIHELDVVDGRLRIHRDPLRRVHTLFTRAGTADANRG